MISNKSILDFNTFCSIYSYEIFDFELLDNNIDGKIIMIIYISLDVMITIKSILQPINIILKTCKKI